MQQRQVVGSNLAVGSSVQEVISGNSLQWFD
jgi:hypothetical protein